MFFRQLVNFVTVKQDDGREVVIKYMLTHRDPGTYGILAEKHFMLDGEMCFVEECETQRSYSLYDALRIAEVCASGKVLPTTHLEIEEELHQRKVVNVG